MATTARARHLFPPAALPRRDARQHARPARRSAPRGFADEAARDLAEELRRHVRGEVRFDDGTRALYATDASNYRQVPIGVVLPRDAGDVEAACDACRRYGAPILSRGGGTSLAGQCCNVAVVLDFSKYMHRVLELDPERRVARVEPGVVLDSLRAAAEGHHLTFGPDPSTHDHCTLGGMIGNNSCGVHSVMAGKTVDNVEEMDVLLADGTRMRVGACPEGELATRARSAGRHGQIYAALRELRDRHAAAIRTRFPRIPRRVSGYNLDELLPENGCHLARALVGSEGTCAVVLEATVRLVPSPPQRVLLVLGYPDVAHAADDVPRILEHGPIGLEGIDDRLATLVKLHRMHLEALELLPEGDGWLFVELGGDDPAELSARAHRVQQAICRGPGAPSCRLLEDPVQQRRLFAMREAGLGVTAHSPGSRPTWPGWEDSAVHPDRLGAYLRDLRALFREHGHEGAFYGHFGQGCVHVRIDFDLETRGGIRGYREFVESAADLVIRHGGSLSGEHGDGQARGELLPRMFGEELYDAFRAFKHVWDPENRMNPGKLVDARPLDEDLRLGTGYRPPEPSTTFSFVEDRGSFAQAALRCVGVGACRREHGGTMCPSYRVTLEEKHSTRGRARLLFEMLEGEVIGRHRWRDEAVKEALDLCLACKGCKGECPVRVDMATYKAEFLSHYWAGRLRPRSAYAFGWIRRWASLAARAPGIANLFTRTPLLRTLAGALAGVTPQRTLPPFAAETFRRSFQRRRGGNAAGGELVLLFTDTFNDHFRPGTLSAAVEVLERAGCRVELSPPLCCGRPLYDYGFLADARRHLRRILDALRPELERGTPIVGLEPSCIATFHDELPNLFPHDVDAERLAAQTTLLPDFLEQRGSRLRVAPLRGKALLHGHCHQKALSGMTSEVELLRRLGLDVELLDTGCCGMAGAFGYEAGEQYRVSIACGERALLPAVRAAAPDTWIVADGFSCREQIEQTTERRALHVAELLAVAAGGKNRDRALPVERSWNPPEARPARIPPAVAAAAALALATGLVTAGRAAARRRATRRSNGSPASLPARLDQDDAER